MENLFRKSYMYALLLVVIVVGSEYTVMWLLNVSKWDILLTDEVGGIVDALLLIAISAGPIYYFIFKPILRNSIKQQQKLNNLVEALDGAGEGVIITDSTGVIDYVNKSFQRVTGYSAEEAIGQTPKILQSGKHSQAFYTMMWRSISQKGDWEGEVWNKRKNGEIYPERLHIKSILDHHGRVKCYVGVISDISEEKQRDKMLRQSQKMETIGILTSGVAHNFNNMLAAITGKCYLAKRYITEPAALSHITSIENISDEAALLVGQLLSYSHERTHVKHNVSLRDIIVDATNAVSLAMEEHIEFITDYTDEPLMIYGDPSEIKQVFINLVTNACDALEGSDIKWVTVTLKGLKRGEGAHQIGVDFGLACLTVEDTGIGINESDLEHICDPFFTTKSASTGTGLGLSITKGIVAAHLGEMVISSQLGQGTKVEIFFPISSLTQQQRLAPAETKHASVQCTILILDDEPVVLMTLSESLQGLGYGVIKGNDGEDGLRKFEAHKESIALVISDVSMPHMDGPVAVALMREIKPHLPVILMTSYRHKTMDYGDDIISIPKPIQIQQLSHIIYSVLDGKSHPEK